MPMAIVALVGLAVAAVMTVVMMNKMEKSGKEAQEMNQKNLQMSLCAQNYQADAPVRVAEVEAKSQLALQRDQNKFNARQNGFDNAAADAHYRNGLIDGVAWGSPDRINYDITSTKNPTYKGWLASARNSYIHRSERDGESRSYFSPIPQGAIAMSAAKGGSINMSGKKA